MGSVIGACLADAGARVLGVDPDPGIVAGLAEARPAVSEPGLSELIARNLERLRFTCEAQPLAEASQAWVAFDTPVDEDDRADVEWVLASSARLLTRLRAGALVIVSSQLPVGSVAELQARCAALRGSEDLRFACVPENLRLGDAVSCFRAPERIVAGVRSEADRQELAEVLAPFSTDVQWMGVESAEMTKHALNGFLATSVAFINEIASLCELVGADASEVARGLKSERRIGPHAYLEPGGAFAGGTLARDVRFLCGLAERHRLPSHVCQGVANGNAAHKLWSQRKLLQLLGEGELDGEPLAGRVVTVWGLTYKPGTDTLRRSSAVELCHWLKRMGASIRAHDPAIGTVAPSLEETVSLLPSPLEAAQGGEALVICTAWPEYREVPMGDVLSALARPLVIDPSGWLGESMSHHRDACHLRVGFPGERQESAPKRSISPAPRSGPSRDAMTLLSASAPTRQGVER